MGFTLLLFFVALAMSGVAAWYSIIGLMAIFAAAATHVAIMGVVLEAGKLVTASWLYRNWRTAPKLIRGYLSGAVIVLMFITSMGIFGFLSKAHIDQTLGSGDNTLQIQSYNQLIEQQERRIIDADKIISQLDAAVDVLVKYDRIRGSEGAIAVRKSQTKERRDLSDAIEDSNEEINRIRGKKSKLDVEQLMFEAEIGPIKYIAELFVNDSKDVIDDAVRWVIITIVFVFDPVAVLLIIAGNMHLVKAQSKPQRRTVVAKEDKEWEETDEDPRLFPEQVADISVKEKRAAQNTESVKAQGGFSAQ